VPEAKIIGKVGRLRSFEVSVNGNVISSKLEEMKFPSFSWVNQDY